MKRPNTPILSRLSFRIMDLTNLVRSHLRCVMNLSRLARILEKQGNPVSMQKTHGAHKVSDIVEFAMIAPNSYLYRS